MRFPHALAWLLTALLAPAAMAWSNHSLAAYRAFEAMPEVSNASAVVVESLEAFLRAEEYTLEALLASQEAWAVANIEKYPVRPPALAFKADPARSDEARRLSFLQALRVASDGHFALFYQSDPWNPTGGSTLPFATVSSLPEAPGPGYRFIALRSGDSVPALAVLATACNEPDYGLDNRLWEDSGTEAGRTYGLGPQPYGNASPNRSTQSPLHSAYWQESRLVSMTQPGLRRSLLPLRFHQFATLSALAFRTGHSYWGWRFAGQSLHYLQELTQPYLASRAPGESGLRLAGTHSMALAGMAGPETNLLQQQTRRQDLAERYLVDQLLRNASARQEGALEKALHNTEKDRTYPDWNDRYLREVVSPQAARLAPTMAQTISQAFAGGQGADAATDEAAGMGLDLLRRDSPERQRLDASLAELMANFAAHSRNGLRGILRASDPF